MVVSSRFVVDSMKKNNVGLLIKTPGDAGTIELRWRNRP